MRVPPDSVWFEGHFPNAPILPGVALVGMVLAVIEKIEKTAVGITRIQRVRFKKIVHPNEQLMVSISRGGREQRIYQFDISSEQGVACNGSITAAPAAEHA